MIKECHENQQRTDTCMLIIKNRCHREDDQWAQLHCCCSLHKHWRGESFDSTTNFIASQHNEETKSCKLKISYQSRTFHRSIACFISRCFLSEQLLCMEAISIETARCLDWLGVINTMDIYVLVFIQKSALSTVQQWDSKASLYYQSGDQWWRQSWSTVAVEPSEYLVGVEGSAEAMEASGESIAWPKKEKKMESRDTSSVRAGNRSNDVDSFAWSAFDVVERNHCRTCSRWLDPMSNSCLCLAERRWVVLAQTVIFHGWTYLDCLVNEESSENSRSNSNCAEWNFARLENVLCSTGNVPWWTRICHWELNDAREIAG